jgi:citrate lyase subunit beta/citryl-CoA lyase
MRMALVLASRRAGIGAAVDGVTVDTRNPERLAQDAARGAWALAASCAFTRPRCSRCTPSSTPTPPPWPAQRLCQALAEAGGGVCVLDGRMVDAPVLHLAQQTLARHAWAQQRMHRKT